MDSQSAAEKTSFRAALATYYLTLIAFVVGTFFPEGRVWGINQWAFFPIWIPLATLAGGALLPLAAARTFLRHGNKPPDLVESDPAVPYAFYAGGVVAVAGLAFYFFRTTTHFLGDGYQNLAGLATGPWIKSRELGESLIHVWVKNLIGGDPHQAALASYRVISIGSGVILLAATALAARKLFARNLDRFLFLAGLASSGCMALFFGYVENYSMFVMSAGLFTLVGLLVAGNKLRRWYALAALVPAVFFHVLGVILIPAAVYLLFANSHPGSAIMSANRKLKGLPALAVIIIFLSLFSYFYATNLFFRFAFVPLFSTRFAAPGYTLVSWSHLSDLANLLLVLLPALPVIAATAFTGLRWRLPRRIDYRFLIILTVCSVGAAFIFDPKLGMPRDWDLFSFAGISLSTAGYYFLITRCQANGGAAVTAALAIALGLLSLAPRVAVLNVDDVAIAHFKNYLELDHVKSRNAWKLLADYYQMQGQDETARKTIEAWHDAYPEVALVERAADLKEHGNCPQAVDILHQSLAINPLYPDAWWHLGECYVALGRYDSALFALRLADGLNPNNSITINNLGAAYLYQGDLKRAEKAFLRAASLDPASRSCLINLVAVYRMANDSNRYAQYLVKLISNFDTPVDYYQALVDYYLSRKDFVKAGETFRQALSKGADTMYVKQMLQNSPWLREYLPRR